MRRKISVILVVILFMGMIFVPMEKETVLAATNRAEQVINALEIMNTDQGNNAKATEAVTRDRFAQMLVNLSTLKDNVSADSNVSLFSDVKRNHWAAGYIQSAVSQGWMYGYMDGSFKPEKGITLREAVYGLIKLLGYNNSDFSGNLTGGMMTLYKTKSMNKNISKKESSYLTSEDCIQLFYNTLNATTKEGKIYGSVLGYSLDTDNEVDYLSIVNTGTEGPVVVDENWRGEIPFSLSQATYYKNGKQCSYSEVEDYDVLYYSELLKSIWIYEDKVTGKVEAINPDYVSPASVTVSGKEFNFADSKVALKFSSMGKVKEGDMITLLLGKENKIVDVLSLDEFNTTITGVVLETGSHLVEKSNGGYSNSNYVTFVDATGCQYQQDFEQEYLYYYSIGDLVRVTYKDGIASVEKYTRGDIDFGNNIISKDGSSFGDKKFASNVKILDIKDGQFISVYPERLAGVTIGESRVFYYELNDNGDISQLILGDVTGDMNQYGVYTGLTNQGHSVVYQYMIDGKPGSLVTDTLTDYAYSVGPKEFVFENNQLKASYTLLEITVQSVGLTSVQDGKMKYPLADGCDVYYLLDGEYIPATIDMISDLTKYRVKAYCDDAVTSGGRVRVIVAENLK